MATAEDVKNEIANIVNSTAKLEGLVQLEMAQHLMAGAYNMLTRVRVISLQKRQKQKKLTVRKPSLNTMRRK